MDKCYNKCGSRRLFYIVDFECGNENGDYVFFWVCEKCLYNYIDLDDDFDNPHYLLLKEETQNYKELETIECPMKVMDIFPYGKVLVPDMKKLRKKLKYIEMRKNVGIKMGSYKTKEKQK